MIENETNRLSRLTAILTQLQTTRLITATTLAEKYRVSVRTIYRDIRSLEQSGVPILTEEGRGYSLMEGYRVPPISFTEDEANALITAEQLILTNRDSSFVQHYSDAISKIKAVLRHSTRENAIMLSERIAVSQNLAQDRTSSYLSSLQLAIINFTVVNIAYQKADATETTTREVEPFALLSGQEHWMLGAWCRLRKEFRLFRLDRIKHIQIQSEKFTPHKLTMAEYLEFLKNK